MVARRALRSRFFVASCNNVLIKIDDSSSLDRSTRITWILLNSGRRQVDKFYITRTIISLSKTGQTDWSAITIVIAYREQSSDIITIEDKIKASDIIRYGRRYKRKIDTVLKKKK